MDVNEGRDDTIRLLSPGQYLNQHSFSIAAVASFVLLAVWLLRDGIKSSDLIALGALVAGLALAYALFNPGPSSESSAEHVLAGIGAGTPVLLEFQSPY